MPVFVSGKDEPPIVAEEPEPDPVAVGVLGGQRGDDPFALRVRFAVADILRQDDFVGSFAEAAALRLEPGRLVGVAPHVEALSPPRQRPRSRRRLVTFNIAVGG